MNDSTLKELVGGNQSQRNWRGIAIALFVIVFICGLIIVAIIIVMPRDLTEELGEPFTFEDIFNVSFTPKHFKGNWIGKSNTIVYKSEENELVAFDVTTNTRTVFMNKSIFQKLSIDKFEISQDLNYALLACGRQKVYRHSNTAEYWIYQYDADTQQKQLVRFPHGNDWEGKRLQYAGWAPTGHALSFVYKNNLYYQADPESEPKQVTSTGIDHLVFNGIPDWVYEEEILGSSSAHWWSPDGAYICFATFNDTEVPIYRLPYYGTTLYGDIEEIAYPKAGDPDADVNPKVQLYVYSTADSTAGLKQMLPPTEFRDSEHYLTQVVWRDNKHILVVWSNRPQNKSIITVCAVDSAQCNVNQIETSHEGRGWVEIPRIQFINGGEQYLVILPTKVINKGYWRHVNIVSAPIGKPGIRNALTHGDWDATQIVGYDTRTSDVYFIGTNGDPRRRHLFRVSASQPSDGSREAECISCDNPEGCQYVKAIFCHDASYYLLHCLGPGVPDCVLKNTQNTSGDIWLEDNSELKQLLSGKAVPRKEYMDIKADDGHIISAQIFLPAELNKEHIVLYPMLVETYAGPGSQLVTEKFHLGWSTYMSSSNAVIYVQVDGRGSAARGDRHMHAIYRQLGTLEVDDQITAARYIRDKYRFVDDERIAIWGSSYGGFVTSHALADPSNVFTCGVAMAPVTDWRYYDTVYTERYMGIARDSDNFRGYDNAKVSRKAAMFRGKHFMLVHGTADDNVHFQHTAQLIKALTEIDVAFRIQLYTDRRHSLAGPHTRHHLYRTITNFLRQECWEGGEPREKEKTAES